MNICYFTICFGYNLGDILTEDLTLKDDIQRATNAFLRQFNGFYSKFSFLNGSELYYLFKTFSTSFYGANLWFEAKFSTNLIRNISVSYHKAVKKTAGLKPWDSNHQACTTVQINIFQHLWIKRMVNHFFSLVNSENTIIKGLKYYFYMQSNFKNFLSCVFSK